LRKPVSRELHGRNFSSLGVVPLEWPGKDWPEKIARETGIKTGFCVTNGQLARPMARD
jgi:hypothetical protein